MKRIFVFLVISVFLFSCATSKKKDGSTAQNKQSYSFEYLPQLKGVPEKLVLESGYVYSGGRFLDGISTEDGGYLFTGKVTRVENIASGRYSKRVGNPFVVKMNENGEISWKIVVDAVRGNTRLSTVVRETNDYFALLSKDSTITKIDKNGKIIEVIDLDFKATSMEVIDNGFVFTSASKGMLSVVWTDLFGNIKKSEDIENEKISFSNSIVVDSESNYYAYGYFNEKETDSSGIYVYKFSKIDKIWRKEFLVSKQTEGKLSGCDIRIENQNIEITTNKEIFIIDPSGEEKHRYLIPAGESQSRIKRLNGQRVLSIKSQYNLNHVIIKTISFTGEITDLTNHLYFNDSLNLKNSPRIVFSRIVSNDKDLFLAGAVASGRRESPYLRKIVLDESFECPKISVTRSPRILLSSEREEIFKDKEWIEDSVTFKNTGGTIQHVNETEKDNKKNIQLKTDQNPFIIYPDQEKTVIFKYNKNASWISFRIPGVMCPTPKYSTIDITLTK